MGAIETLAKNTNLSEVKVARHQGFEGEIVAGGPGVQGTLFTVAVGAVNVLLIFGHVTVAIVGAATPLLNFTPAVNATLVPIATGHASIAADAIDSIEHWNGTVADPLVESTSLGICGTAELAWAGGLLLPPGIITVGNAGAVATGVIDWYCAYVPSELGAKVLP